MAAVAELDLVPDRELRILVLHNRDFETQSAPDAAGTSTDIERLSRADVLNAAQTITRALAAHGHFVEVQGIDRDDIGALLDQLGRDRPDLVFNLCESLAGDDRNEVVVPALLDLIDLPYTGSGPLCVTLCRDKYRAKQILRAGSVATPLAALLPAVSHSRSDDLSMVESIGYPLFLKVAALDGSVGVSNASVISNDEEFLTQLAYLRGRFHQAVLAERFIAGRELYVSMLGNSPQRLLPMQEIDFSRMPSDLPLIVTENAKWNADSREYQSLESMAASPMPATVQTRVLETAARSFAMLDVRDYGRCDIRLSEDGTPYVIDVNPNCDLTDDAGFSRAGRLGGLPYDRLINEIALVANKRSADAHAQRSPTGHDGHSH